MYHMVWAIKLLQADWFLPMDYGKNHRRIYMVKKALTLIECINKCNIEIRVEINFSVSKQVW